MLLSLLVTIAGALLSRSAAYISLPKTDHALIGAVYQPAANGSFSAFEEAKKKALSVLRKAVKTGDTPFGQLDNKATSFTIQVFSAVNNETLFNFNFEAPALHGAYTKGKLSEKTVYRTGSLGKLMAIYAILVDIGDHIFLDPITKYVPELAEAVRTQPRNPLLFTNWDEVTVGSLASQISGIGRDFHDGDLALGLKEMDNYPLQQTIRSGYPTLYDESVPQCSYYSYKLPLCNRKEFLDGMINYPPSFPSYTKTAYSNVAYSILGFAYENITGRNFAEASDRLFQDRLGMASATSVRPKKDVDAVIPYNDTWAVFSYSIGNQWPSGGQYVSAADLKLFGQAILQSTLLPPHVTRRWMKPASATSQWESNVGAPWEIYRTAISADKAINTTRIVDMYTKSGDEGAYSTFFGLDRDHQLGITVLAAGVDPGGSVFSVASTMVDVFLNGAEKAAKEQAKRAFTGVFRASDRNSSIEFFMDEGPGVSIKEWISNGTHFLHSPVMAPTSYGRLFPADLSHQEGDMRYHSYRAQFTSSAYSRGKGLWTYDELWYEVSFDIYNNRDIDHFIIGIDKDGVVQSVEPVALRVVLYRES